MQVPVFYSFAETKTVETFFRTQTNHTNPLFGYLVGPGTEPMNQKILRPFSTDGCSQSPDKLIGVEIVDCCVRHDIAYWLGGTREEKEESDRQLGQCIQRQGSELMAKAYQTGVAIGGSPTLKNTFRWGYGWDSVRQYGPITPSEWNQAERLYGKDLIYLRTMIDEKKYEINFELNTLDFATGNRWHDDIIVYNLLQNHLKKKDVVAYGQKISFTHFTLDYLVNLKTCSPNHPIQIKLDRIKMILDIVKLYRNIYQMNWSQLKPYILSIDDPEHCLNPL